jgi:hypothetical protein
MYDFMPNKIKIPRSANRRRSFQWNVVSLVSCGNLLKRIKAYKYTQ